MNIAQRSNKGDYQTRRKTRFHGEGIRRTLAGISCFPAFCVLKGVTMAGHAVSACGEIVRAFRNMWLVHQRKIPTREYLRRKPNHVPLGSLIEARTRLWRGVSRYR